MSAKASDGVTSTRPAPIAPPRIVSGSRRRTRGAWPRSSGREPSIEPTLLTARAMVLVWLAATGERPIASSAG